ncbi:MAG: cobalamin B12-binding domain-containing protein [Promethearchaeia archaeon]
MPAKLKDLIIDLNEEESVTHVQERIDSGEDPLEILNEVRGAMDIVGKKFEEKEFFLPDLIMSGEILSQITEILEPKLKEGAERETEGELILGTVKGDIHDIGKDIVKFMLEANGFKVHDLGVDVPVEDFVDALKTHDAKILALSGFLSLAFDSMKETVEAIKNEGLREDIKIMIGGGQINDDVKNYVGADAFGDDAVKAVKLAKAWTES